MRICKSCGLSETETDFGRGKKKKPYCNPCRREVRRDQRIAGGQRVYTVPEERYRVDGTIQCCRCLLYVSAEQIKAGQVRVCRPCDRAYQARQARERGVPEKQFTVIEDGKKRCNDCLNWFPLDQFQPSTRGRGGVGAYCRRCCIDRYYDRDKGRAQSARWRAQNRARSLAQHRIHQYQRKHRQAVSSDGSVTPEVVRELYAQRLCHYCAENTPEGQRTLDHKVPLSKGGGHVAGNIVMACKSCNCSKQDKTEEEFNAYKQRKKEHRRHHRG